MNDSPELQKLLTQIHEYQTSIEYTEHIIEGYQWAVEHAEGDGEKERRILEEVQIQLADLLREEEALCIQAAKHISVVELYDDLLQVGKQLKDIQADLDAQETALDQQPEEAEQSFHFQEGPVQAEEHTVEYLQERLDLTLARNKLKLLMQSYEDELHLMQTVLRYRHKAQTGAVMPVVEEGALPISETDLPSSHEL
jgi:hypothetical protein